MSTHEYDLDLVASTCREACIEVDGLSTASPALEAFCNRLDAAHLKAFARAFMEDSHEFSPV